MDSLPNKSVSAEEKRVLLYELEKELEREDPKLFKGVAPEKKQQILTRLAVTYLKVKQHSGPLPDAETLAEYDRIVPGSADRIITLLENQTHHRMGLEKTAVERQTFQSGLGQIFAFVLGMSALGGGVWCILADHDVAGGSIIGSGLLSLAAAFLRSTSSQKQELEGKKSK